MANDINDMWCKTPDGGLICIEQVSAVHTVSMVEDGQIMFHLTLAGRSLGLLMPPDLALGTAQAVASVILDDESERRSPANTPD
jgi:hypothetical protein